MPRVAVEANSRMSLRIRPDEKALLLRAATLEHTDLVSRSGLRAAKCDESRASAVAQPLLAAAARLIGPLQPGTTFKRSETRSAKAARRRVTFIAFGGPAGP